MASSSRSPLRRGSDLTDSIPGLPRLREGAGRNFRSGNESQDAKICICLPDVGLSTLGPDEEVKEMTHKQVTGSHWESGISLSSKLGSVSLKPNGIPDTQRQTEARSVRPP